MRTAIIVVGALRGMELCSKTWEFPFFAKFHLLTWTTKSDARSDEFSQVNVGDFKACVKFMTTQIFDREEYGIPMTASGNQTAMAFMWKKAYDHLRYDYDRFVFIRPDLFIWPQRPFPADYDPDVSGAAFVANTDRTWIQDQFFIVSRKQLEVLSHAYETISTRDMSLGINDIHTYLSDLHHSGQMEFNLVDLCEAFHFFLVRPNSSHLRCESITFELASKVNRLTADWWKEKTGFPYQGYVMGL